MKVVILAGGLPSNLIEEDEKIPKPMAEIGGRPILWHIMKQYSFYGYRDFIICAGYKLEMIKDYFMNFYIYQSDITVDLQTNQVTVHRKKTEDWNVTVVDTGLHTSVVDRILMIQERLAGEAFLVTYGDCVSDIRIDEMFRFHQGKEKLLTFAVARPTGRNRILSLNDEGEPENPARGQKSREAWVNACSMVCEPGVMNYFRHNGVFLGEDMLAELSRDQQAVTYRHEGFWSPMETVRDKTFLDAMWNQKKAPWKVWED